MAEAWETDPEAAFEEARRRIAAWRERPLDLRLPALERLPEEIAAGPSATNYRRLQTADGQGFTTGDGQPFFVRDEATGAGGTQGSTDSEATPHAGLAQLDLSGTKITDIAPLAGLSRLQSLSLRGTHVIDVSPVATLGLLRWLDLSLTEVTDISVLAGLDQLAGFDLSDTQVAEISHLAGLSRLTWLDLTGTEVGDLLPLAGLELMKAEASAGEFAGLCFRDTPATHRLRRGAWAVGGVGAAGVRDTDHRLPQRGGGGASGAL